MSRSFWHYNCDEELGLSPSRGGIDRLARARERVELLTDQLFGHIAGIGEVVYDLHFPNMRLEEGGSFGAVACAHLVELIRFEQDPCDLVHVEYDENMLRLWLFDCLANGDISRPPVKIS